MKKVTFLFIAIAALSFNVFGQERLLTIDDIFSPVPSERVAFGGSPTRFVWAADGRSFKQIEGEQIKRVDAITGESKPFYDTQRFVNALAAAGVLGARDAYRLANSIALKFNSTETAILLNQNNDLWHYDIAAGTLKRLTNNPEPEVEEDYSPDGKWVSFVRGNDLYVASVGTGEAKRVTTDGSKTVHNGILVWVYEEELYGRGQKRGYWWSPDSKHIAFLRLDDAPVPKFVLTNDIPAKQIVEETNYPKAGDPNPLVRLGIADVTKSSMVPSPGSIPLVGDLLPGSVQRFGDAIRFADLKKYKPEDLLIARVAWTPDSERVLFQALNREQTFLDLNAAKRDGSVTKLLTETTAAWVEVYDDPIFAGRPQDSREMMVWQSARDGWRHLYLYDEEGRLVRRLTDGKWEVRAVHGVDTQNGWVYFSGTKDSHIEENQYRVALRGGEVERLTKGEGNFSATFNSTFTHFVGGWSDIHTPHQQRLYKADGTIERVINENKVAVLDEFKLSKPEFMKVKTRDGFEMEAVMIKPPDFDPTKKYPVLQYTYAGPHAPQVRNTWTGNRYLWHQMLAQKGYIVWICDNRTASGKGEESTWPVYKQMGTLELRDIEDGVNFLKEQPFVDVERIGIWGWSYGGFMTSYALTHSKLFKMGIAGGSVTDWALYDSIYTERFMLTPQNNRAGYEKTSVIKAAKDLHGKLLLIHGVMDDNVHQQNTIQLVNELQKHNKQFELMLYPGQRHGIVNPQQTRHMYQMMTDFILRNL